MPRVFSTSQKLLVGNPYTYSVTQWKNILNHEEFPGTQGPIYFTERPKKLIIEDVAPHHHYYALQSRDFVKFSGLTVLGIPDVTDYQLKYLKPPIDILILDRGNIENGAEESHLEGMIQYWSPSLIIVNEPLKNPSTELPQVMSVGSTHLLIERAPSRDALIVVQRTPARHLNTRHFPLISRQTAENQPYRGKVVSINSRRRGTHRKFLEAFEIAQAMESKSHIHSLLRFVYRWMQELGEAFNKDALNCLDTILNESDPQFVEYLAVNREEESLLVKSLFVRLELLPKGLAAYSDKDVIECLNENGLTSLKFDDLEAIRDRILDNYDQAIRLHFRDPKKCLSTDQKYEWRRTMGHCPPIFLKALSRLTERPKALVYLLDALGISKNTTDKKLDPPSSTS